MLIRDPHNAGATGLVRMWRELVKRDREVVAFLIDHHPCDSRLITSNVLIGCGWDHHDGRDSIRWFGDGFSPAGTGSHLVDNDPEVAMVHFDQMTIELLGGY